jgi:hypothetical protein
VIKLAFIAALLIGTCAFAPPDGAIPMRVPAHYREVWDSAQACTHRSGDFARVKWYVMPGNSFPTDDGAAIGLWGEPHTITIAGDWMTTDWVVKHEMIHDLTHLRHDGEGGRPGPRDSLVWGRMCHAMWGFQPRDTSYVP